VEVNLLNNLMEAIREWRASDLEDGWWWWWRTKEKKKVFSINSAYMLLEEKLRVKGPFCRSKKVFEAIWKSPTPSKVEAFS
jgi:hypothetical protein